MNTRSGYSILEVLIAFAVMSMTLAVLLPGQVQLLGRTGMATERVLAHEWAVSRLETISVLGTEGAMDTFDNWRTTESTTITQGRTRITVSVFAANGRLLAEVSRAMAVNDAQ